MSEVDALGIRFPHQLFVHVDLCPPDQLSVAYSYPMSRPRLPETRVTLPSTGARAVRGELMAVLAACLETLDSGYWPSRLPSAAIPPTWHPGCLTVVVQDYRRREELPLARLYLNERVELLSSQTEHELRISNPGLGVSVADALSRVCSWAKGVAWADYKGRFGEYFIHE